MFIVSCLSRSTAHGISHAARSKSILQRCIWLVVFLSSSCLFIYYFRANLLKYYAQPTSVRIEVGGAKFVAPDIHVCNINPLAKSRLIDPWALMNSTLLKSLQEELKELETRISRLGINFKKTDFFWTSVQREKLYAAVGHLLRQTVLTAALDSGDIIQRNNFEITSNLNYFTCFRVIQLEEKGFNSTSNALNLHLYTDSYHFKKTSITFDNVPLSNFDFISQPSVMGPSGIQLIFTPPGEYPHIESHSVLVSPGRYTTIKLKMQTTVSANTRRDPCTVKKHTVRYHNPLLGFNVTTKYRKTFADCKYRKIVERMMREYDDCQCLPYMVPVGPELASKYPVCGNMSTALNENMATVIQNQLNCREYYSFLEAEFDATECSGEKPCEAITYSSDVSSTDWPLLDDINNILQELVPTLESKSSPINTPGLIRFLEHVKTNSSLKNDMTKYNFARVLLVPGETKSLRIVESVSYGVENLVSDIGGVAGLCLGMSILTVLEIFDLLYDFFVGTDDEEENAKE